MGRKKELIELRRLLGHTRLLTILGPGGVGKTRLAQKFIERYAQEGSVFAELGEIADGALVVDAIARAARIRLEGADRPSSLARGMGDRGLLVVDNCEHLPDGAATAVTHLLRACPGLTVVATSRERLNVEGELAWTLPPLGVPATGDDVKTADASDAARLFADRARSVRPGFLLEASNAAAVLSICRRLDGIPLAIELAAARMTTLSPQDIVPRLETSLELLTGGTRGAVTRQRTLRATIDWSHGLLGFNEQRVLQRMSVFVGAPDADAVQEVCAFPSLDRAAVLDALARLVDKSMVQVDAAAETMCYRLLETIREYAGEKLVEAAEADEAHGRHLARYRRLAQEAYVRRRHHGATPEHRRLWAEMNDVRAALDWARRDPETELEMVANLYLLWMVNAPIEGFERVTESLLRSESTNPDLLLRATQAWNALGGITGLKTIQTMRPEWQELEGRSVALLAATDDPFYRAALEMGLGYVAERQLRDESLAREHMQAAVDIERALGPGPQLAMHMGSLGGVEARLGRPEVGREWIEKALAMTLETDDQYGAVGAYFHLGRLELDHGTPERAIAAFIAGLELVEPGDTLSTTDQAAGVACAMTRVDPRWALRVFSAATRLRAPVAPPNAGPWAPRIEAGIEEARAALPASDGDAAWATGGNLTLEILRTEVLERFRRPAGGRTGSAHGLSRRELEIADLVAAGMTSRAISEKLFLSERTVETHLTHVMTKLGFNSRAQVAAWVAEHRAAG